MKGWIGWFLLLLKQSSNNNLGEGLNEFSGRTIRGS